MFSTYEDYCTFSIQKKHKKEYDSRIITSDRIINAFVDYQTKDADEDAFKFGFLFYLTLFNEYYKQNAVISAM